MDDSILIHEVYDDPSNPGQEHIHHVNVPWLTVRQDVPAARKYGCAVEA